MLKHHKSCTKSDDVKHMIFLGCQGSMKMHDVAFKRNIFKDIITDALLWHNLTLYFIECKDDI